jgi:flagellar biosynthesis/type III secretory pathway protein FliH
MTVTVSLETYILNEFDSFFLNTKFEGIHINPDLKLHLDDLEHRILECASQEHTSEMEQAREEAFEAGYESGFYEGEIEGYDRGLDAGYDQAIEDYDIEV